MEHTEILAVLEQTLSDQGIPYGRKSSGGAKSEHLVLDLPGENKLKTTVLLTAGRYGVRVEAFVCRRPDENFAEVYKFLLKRNRRIYGVSYTLDNAGDIYLVGRISTQALTPEEIDRVLGQVLEAADGDFNTLLEIGFITSIHREWAWRVARGESLRNLRPFEHLIDESALPEIGEYTPADARQVLDEVARPSDAGDPGADDPAAQGRDT